MLYSEMFQLTFSCPFHLANFPFDSHQCNLTYGGHYPTKWMTLNPPYISYWEKKTSLGKVPIMLNNFPLPFEFELQPLPSFER